MLFALVLAILVKLLIETENPLLCAGIYTTLVLIFGLLGLGFGSASWIELFSGVLIAFLLSFVSSFGVRSDSLHGPVLLKFSVLREALFPLRRPPRDLRRI